MSNSQLPHSVLQDLCGKNMLPYPVYTLLSEDTSANVLSQIEAWQTMIVQRINLLQTTIALSASEGAMDVGRLPKSANRDEARALYILIKQKESRIASMMETQVYAESLVRFLEELVLASQKAPPPPPGLVTNAVIGNALEETTKLAYEQEQEQELTDSDLIDIETELDNLFPMM